MLPIEATLERTARWSHGAVQLGPSAEAEVRRARTVPRQVLPPRERQNAHTLAEPGLDARAVNRELGLAELYSNDNFWYSDPPAEALRALAAPELLADAIAALPTASPAAAATDAMDIDDYGGDLEQQQQQQGTRRVPNRIVTTDVGAITAGPAAVAATLAERGLVQPGELHVAGMNATDRAAHLTRTDYGRRFLRFFAEEMAPAAQSMPERAPPATYPMLQELRAKYGARYDQRANLAAEAGATMPRSSLETIPRRYFFRFRLPPVPGSGFRACCNDERCRFVVFAHLAGRPLSAYKAAEFLRPSELAAWNERRSRGLPVSEEVDGPRGPCIDCLLYEWTAAAHHAMQIKGASPEAINTFQVECQEGEYAREYMLPNEISGQRTGIVGFVPAYSVHTRQLESLDNNPSNDEPALALSYPQGFVFVNEIGQHFHDSLGRANACLGAPKSRPLAGSSGCRFAMDGTLRSVFLPRWSTEQLVASAPAWVRFMRDCHAGVLADRYWLADLEERGGAGVPQDRLRIPAAWLRHTLGLTSSSLHAAHRAVEPVVETLTMAPGAAAVLARLCSGRPPDAAAAAFDIGRALRRLADMAFCSYERGTALWLHAVRAHDAVAMAPLLTFLGRGGSALGGGETRGLPLPDAFEALLANGATPDAATLCQTVAEREDVSFVLWASCAFRCGVALLYEHGVVWPPGDRDAERMAYMLRLFRDTHLDLLTHCVVHGRYDDSHLFATAPVDAAKTAAVRPVTPRPALPWLALVYPQANRVCCAEELPDLVPALLLGNPYFDTGNRKALETVLQVMVRIFICKVMHGVCQRRQFSPIVERGEAKFPVIGHLFRLVLRCVVLGNLPRGVAQPLPLAARVRVNAALGPHADPVLVHGFRQWASEHSIVTLFALREFFFYTAESSGLSDEFLARSLKWSRFKALVRLANGNWRAELARQTAAPGGFWAPIDWTVVEHHTQSGSGGEQCFSGTMALFHEQSLSTFVKLRKGRFEEVLLKKMTAVENEIDRTTGERRVPLDTTALLAWLREDERLEWLHFVAWVAARRATAAGASLRERVLFDTRPLVALGLSRAGHAALRTWLFEYHEYEVHDNSFKARIEQFIRQDARDYALLKTFLRRFVHFRGSSQGGTLFFQPIEQARAQTQALRASLGIEPWCATPPLLGVAYYCEGCMTLANPVMTPTLTLRGGTDASAVSALPVSAVRFTAPMLEELAFQSNATDGHCASLRAAYYHPIDGHLYCRRSAHTQRDGGGGNNGDDASDNVDEEGAEDMEEEDEEEEEEEEEERDIAALMDGMSLADADPVQWAKQHTQAVASAAAALAPAKKNKVSVRDISRQALLPNLRCGRLVKVDLVGVVMSLNQRLYGLCVYCGRVCEVVNANVTLRGMSCGLHSIAAEYPSYHRLWASLEQTRALLQHASRARLTQSRADRLRPPCVACQQPAARMAEGFDMQHRRFHVPVCAYHGHKLGLVRSQREVLLASDLIAPSDVPLLQPVPMRVDQLASELGLPLNALACR